MKINKNLKGMTGYVLENIECKHRLHIIENILEHHPDVLTNKLQSSDLYLYPVNGKHHFELKKSICDYLDVKMDQILLTAGSDGALKLICDTFITSESNVLVPVPTYPNMTHFIKSSEGLSLEKYKEVVVKESMKEIENNLNQETDLVYICSPNLPLGYTIKLEWLKKILTKFEKCMFIVDEAYIEYASANSCVEVIQNHKNVIITRTFSKAFALAGLRIGYALACKEIINLLSISYNCKSVTLLAIKAANACLKNLGYYKNQLLKIKESKNYLDNELSKIIDNNCLITNYTLSDAAWFFIYSPDPDKVVKIFELSGITVRNKKSEIPGGIRIAYGTTDIMEDVIKVCKLVNLKKIIENAKIVFDMDGVLRPGSHGDKRFYSCVRNLLNECDSPIVLTNNESYPEIIKKELINEGIDAQLITSTMNALKICENRKLNPLIVSKDSSIISMFNIDLNRVYDSVILIDNYWINQSVVNTICNILNAGGTMFIVDNENRCIAEDTPRGDPPVIPTGVTPSMGLFKELFKKIGYKVEIVGKPAGSIADNFNIRGNYQFMIGNTLETDYEFAKNAGLQYIHVDPKLEYPKYNYEGYYMIPHINYIYDSGAKSILSKWGLFKD